MASGYAVSNGTSYLNGGRIVSDKTTTYALGGGAGSGTCSNCGNVFMPDSVFCRNCGARRSEVEQQLSYGQEVSYGAPSYVAGCGGAGGGSAGEVQRYVTGGTTSYLSQVTGGTTSYLPEAGAAGGTTMAAYEPTSVSGMQQPQYISQAGTTTYVGGGAALQSYGAPAAYGTTTSSYIPPAGVTGATSASYVSPPLGAVAGATSASYLPAAGGASSSYVPAPMMQTTASYVPAPGAASFVGGAATPQMPYMVGAVAQPGMYAAGQQQAVYQPAAAPMVGAPPAPPGRLTEEIPDPSAIDEQKAAYNRGLEEQAKQGEEILKMQQKQQTEYIYQAAEAQKKQIICQIEQQAKQRELQLSQQFSQQCMSLQQEFQNQKMVLERQAHDLAMEWQRRKSQEDMLHQQYEMQKAHYDDQVRMVREMQEAQLSHEQAQKEAQAAMAAQHHQVQAAAMGVTQPQMPTYAAPAVGGGGSFVPPAAPFPPAGSYVPPAGPEAGAGHVAVFAAPMTLANAAVEPTTLQPSQSTGSYVPPAMSYAQGGFGTAAAPAPLGMAGQYGMGASQATTLSMVAPGAASNYSAAPTVYSQHATQAASYAPFAAAGARP